jgi:phthalate 4,5-cis-dihydrodiol dehydrogenase
VNALSSTSKPIGLGVIGLGRAFCLTAPALHAHAGIRVVAAAEPHAAHRGAFSETFQAPAYTDISALLADPKVEAVYVSTPHGLHKEHALAAIAAGKHVLVEKPITVALEDATALIDAADAAGVQLVVGPSHSFDGPVALACALIEAQVIGRVRMIHALYATDFLYRPRTAAELDTDQGGGVVFSQAVHQIDLVRRLASSSATQVTARTGGAWDPTRPTEGAYSMLVDFTSGAFASLTYSGYAHFDGDRLMDNISELGTLKDGQHKDARGGLRAVNDELAHKISRGFTSLAACPQAQTHEHFGQVMVFGENGDLRLSPHGVEINQSEARRFQAAPFRTTRAEVFDTFYNAIRHGERALQDGRWGRASLEICHALRVSAHQGTTISLQHQTN